MQEIFQENKCRSRKDIKEYPKSVRNVTCEFLHYSVGCDCCRVHWERSHHANHIPLKESLPASQSVLLPEA